MELSLILPAYNEGAAVRDAIERSATALARCCRGFEIVVVNDGSTDDTLAVAQEAAAKHKQVRILSNERNLGQVGAVLRGFAEAQGDVVMHNGTDLPFDPNDTAAVLQHIRDGADVVVVQRRNRRAYGWGRKAISWGNIVLVKFLLRSPFTDHNFVQAYRRQVLEALTVESRGVATVTPELILKARAAGFVVVTLKADYANRGSGRSTITLGQICHTAVELLRLAVILRRWRARCTIQRSATIDNKGDHHVRCATKSESR